MVKQCRLADAAVVRAPACSRGAEPKDLGPPGKTARSQPPQDAEEPVSSLTGQHANSPMLSAPFICQHALRTHFLVAHPPLSR